MTDIDPAERDRMAEKLRGSTLKVVSSLVAARLWESELTSTLAHLLKATAAWEEVYGPIGKGLTDGIPSDTLTPMVLREVDEILRKARGAE